MDCRILPDRVSDGPWNLALDEALLDAVDADPGQAVLRFYGWEPATLSLGYFQKWSDAALDPRWQGVPIVRRPTGGGAIWHDRELTYALVVPRSLPIAARAADLYRAVHRAIAGAIRQVGLDARRRADVPAVSGALATAPLLCFLDRDPEDILIGTDKVVGSAQRRRPRAVLQHGSLLLERSPRTPELPGLRELAGLDRSATDWARILQDALPAALGLTPRLDSWTPPEIVRSEELAETVYRQPSWLQRR